MCLLSYSTCLTPGSVEPREAAAGEGAETVQTTRPVGAGVRVALVHIHLTQPAPVALHALTPDAGMNTTTFFIKVIRDLIGLTTVHSANKSHVHRKLSLSFPS